MLPHPLPCVLAMNAFIRVLSYTKEMVVISFFSTSQPTAVCETQQRA